jgi:hypothetical protein
MTPRTPLAPLQRAQLALLLLCVLTVAVASVWLWVVDAHFFFARLPRHVDPTAGAVFALLCSSLLAALSFLLRCVRSMCAPSPASRASPVSQAPRALLARVLAASLCLTPLELLLANAFVVTQRPTQVVVSFLLLVAGTLCAWLASVPWSVSAFKRAFADERRVPLLLSSVLSLLSLALIGVNMYLRADGRYYHGLGTLLSLLDTTTSSSRGLLNISVGQIANFVRSLDLLDALAALLQPMAGFCHGAAACLLGVASMVCASTSLLLSVLALFLCGTVLASSLTAALLTFALDSLELAVPCVLLGVIQLALLALLLFRLREGGEASDRHRVLSDEFELEPMHPESD